jgi:anaphase-promoting complex subunit 4
VLEIQWYRTVTNQTVELDFNNALGQCLAVGWTDDSVDVISTETGDSLQNFRQTAAKDGSNGPNELSLSPPVSCLGWGLSLVDIEAAKERTNQSTNRSAGGSKYSQKASITLEDFLDRIPDLDAIDIPLEVPDQLAQIDVTDLMPKLPSVPAIPANAYRPGHLSFSDLFSSQVTLDAALLSGPARKLNALSSFLIADSEGTIRVMLYDSLCIGNVMVPQQWKLRSVRHVAHYAHPFAHNHILLSSIERDDGSAALVLLPLCLRFLKTAGRNIHFIDFKTAQLGTLVQYVAETLSALHHHWKHAHDLPFKFQRNINETLAEKNEPGLSQSLYQLAATGYCSGAMKEWLVDELSERVSDNGILQFPH